MFPVDTPPPYICADISLEIETLLCSYRQNWKRWEKDEISNEEFIITLKELLTFLEKEKDLIFRRAKTNRWPPVRGPKDPLFCGYRDVYRSLTNSVRNFIENPNRGSCYMINEQLSQLFFLLTNCRQDT
jgi:hypothetical protein